MSSRSDTNTHIGHVEVCAGYRVSGWAWDPSDDKRRLELEIGVAGQHLATVKADLYRFDIESAGIGDGAYGFEFKSTRPLSGETVTVRISGRDKLLDILDPEYTAIENQTATEHHGHIEYCAGRIVNGWAWDPAKPHERLHLELYLDGQQIVTTCANNYRQDLEQAGLGDGGYGFRFDTLVEVDRKDVEVFLPNGLPLPNFDPTYQNSKWKAESFSPPSEFIALDPAQINFEGFSGNDVAFYAADIATLFDGEWYKRTYQDIQLSGIDPLNHFLTRGMLEGRDPNRLFDGQWYYRQYSRADAELHPLLHFLKKGWRIGASPHPLFHTIWYANQFGGVAKIAINALSHYMSVGIRRGMPSTPMFDAAWYLSTYKEAGIDNLNPFLHYLDFGARRGYSPNPFFDVDYYSKQFPKDKKARENSLFHYVETGAPSGADPSDKFSTLGYLGAYMDVRQAGTNPLEHFMRSGLREARDPLGQTKTQVELLPELPIFSRFGGREYGPVEKVLPYTGTTVLPDKVPRVCIHIHLFYSDLADEFVDYLKNIPIDFTLLLTVSEADTYPWAEHFQSRLPRAQKCIIKRVPNVGRDVAPWVVACAAEILEHDIFFHGHTKKSTYRADYSDWRRFLAHNTIGSQSIVTEVLQLFNADPKLGLIYPGYFTRLAMQPAWGGSRNVVMQLAQRIGAPQPPTRCPDYPSGSFFWARTDFLRPLLTCGLTNADFDQEDGQIDGTLAHAVERLIGHLDRMNEMRKLCVTVDVAYNMISFWDTKRLEKLQQSKAPTSSYTTKFEPLGDRRRIAVYTCVTGGFDEFAKPTIVHPDVDYFIYSDVPLQNTAPFKNVLCQYRDTDPRRTARFVKTHPHILLHNYDVAIWTDANILFRTSLARFIAKVDENGADLGVIYHAARSSYIDEANECARIGADERDILQEQLEKYKNACIPKKGLIETNVLVAKLNNLGIRQFYNLWWREIAQYSLRDQVSVNYAATASMIKIAPILPIGRTARDSDDFWMFEHKLRDRESAVGYAFAESNPSAFSRRNAGDEG